MRPLPHSTYVTLTTFRRSGAPAPTPVWAARGDRRAVRRVWRVQGDAVDGFGEFVPRRDSPSALATLRRAYGLRFRLGNASSRLRHGFRRRPGDRHELTRIRPA